MFLFIQAKQIIKKSESIIFWNYFYAKKIDNRICSRRPAFPSSTRGLLIFLSGRNSSGKNCVIKCSPASKICRNQFFAIEYSKYFKAGFRIQIRLFFEGLIHFLHISHFFTYYKFFIALMARPCVIVRKFKIGVIIEKF